MNYIVIQMTKKILLKLCNLKNKNKYKYKYKYKNKFKYYLFKYKIDNILLVLIV
jgi:hypothetical protein